MKFNYSKLRGRIVEKYGSQRKLAEALGITFEALNMKLNGRSPFRQAEMVTISRLLEFPTSDIAKYFFCLESSVK